MARAAVVLLLLVGVLALRQSALRSAPPVERRAGLTFDASVDAPSRALVESALATARPEARRLIYDIAGLVDIRVERPDNRALGYAQPRRDGRYTVVLDLGLAQRTGTRGATRLVLHELGHVVDFELVPDDLARTLDAGIPPTLASQQAGFPAEREERFAETFAKWAMGNDLGANLYIGYAIPPPTSGFDAWASRLVTARSAAP